MSAPLHITTKNLSTL